MDLFLLLFIICPVIVLITSAAGFFLFPKRYIMPLVTFGVFTVLMFVFFNQSFFIWVIMYTCLSAVITFLFTFIRNRKLAA
ncbi:DUF2651 family protein [Jeotgalibacillus sp. ET6]|uniref:DUF2651 family protein n=1 Tax=Jeotgalibacillus sp. ET6 TaxID=3037260 RepID=UPI00241881E9|nr:DUF2651 family protein [Jeotgalibacillus sp. ET6]MDG5472838.1 DUF2651 family protein [Jeotgalibacillus sp. ET6]